MNKIELKAITHCFVELRKTDNHKLYTDCASLIDTLNLGEEGSKRTLSKLDSILQKEVFDRINEVSAWLDILKNNDNEE